MSSDALHVKNEDTRIARTKEDLTESFVARKDKVITMIEIIGYIFDENDDLASVMDAILNRVRFGGCDDKGDEEWIGRTGHRDMEDALEAMMPKEREIVRKYFYEDKRMLDISIEMNMEMGLVGGYIKSARDQMAIWI